MNKRIITVEEIAKVCHEVNKAYCESIGDAAQPTWAKAPKWLKASITDGVRFIILNPKSTPEDSHKNWMAGKLADGWKYGKTKNSKKKLHTDMVDYNDLPIEQKAKDYIFGAIVRSLHAM